MERSSLLCLALQRSFPRIAHRIISVEMSTPLKLCVCVWRGVGHPRVHRPHASPSPPLPVGSESHNGVGHIRSAGVPGSRFGAHGGIGERHRGGVCGGTELINLIDLSRRLSSFGFRVVGFVFWVLGLLCQGRNI